MREVPALPRRPTRERDDDRDEDRDAARSARAAPDPHVRDWHDHRGSSRSHARSTADHAHRRSGYSREGARVTTSLGRDPSAPDSRPRRSYHEDRRSRRDGSGDEGDGGRHGGQSRSRSHRDDPYDQRRSRSHRDDDRDGGDRWRPGRRGPSPDRGYSRDRGGYSRAFSHERRDGSARRGYSRDRDDRARSGSRGASGYRGSSSGRRPSHPREDAEADAAPRGTSVAEILARVRRGEPATTPAPAPAAPAPPQDDSSSSSSSSAGAAAAGATGAAAQQSDASAPGALPAGLAAAIAALSSKALAAGAADEPDPSGPAADAPPSSVLPESASAQATKALREVYIGNLPVGTTGPQLTTFLNQQLVARGLTVEGGGPAPVGGMAAKAGPVIGCRVNAGAQFGFAEFRCIEETVLALGVGELSLGALQLRFGRPRAFVSLYGDDTPQAASASAYILSLAASGAAGPLPRDAPAGAAFPETAERIRAALPGQPFSLLPPPPAPAPAPAPGSAALAAATPGSAPLASAAAAPVGIPSLPMPAAPPAPGAPAAAASGGPSPDRSCPTLEVTGAMENFAAEDVKEMFGGFGAVSRCEVHGEGDDKRAVVEFDDADAAAAAQEALDGLEVGDGAFSVRRMRVDEALACGPSRHVVLRNAVLRSEIASEEDWKEVSEEVSEEARRHGAVTGIHRPAAAAARPALGDDPASLPVYLCFADVTAAAAAAASMTDRRFDGRLVTAHCVTEAAFRSATGE